jgi:hypothetical protein
VLANVEDEFGPTPLEMENIAVVVYFCFGEELEFCSYYLLLFGNFVVRMNLFLLHFPDVSKMVSI